MVLKKKSVAVNAVRHEDSPSGARMLAPELNSGHPRIAPSGERMLAPEPDSRHHRMHNL